MLFHTIRESGQQVISRQVHQTGQDAKRKSNFVAQVGLKYIAFFKPYAVLSQFSKELGSDKKTLADFGFPKDVYPVGRLDFDSEGLLLLSDDSRLNSRLLDPKYGHKRSYLSQVERVPDEEVLKKLASGIIIEGRKTMPAQVRLLDVEPDLGERDVPIRFRKNVATAWLELTLVEGKNRQVRRMTAAVGHPTLRLVRVSIGSLCLDELELSPGQWKYLDSRELASCFS